MNRYCLNVIPTKVNPTKVSPTDPSLICVIKYCGPYEVTVIYKVTIHMQLHYRG